MPRLQRQNVNLRASFLQGRALFRVQRISGVVATFDVDRRAHLFQQPRHTNFGKDNDMVHTFERGHDLGAVALTVEWPAFTLERAHRIVAIDRYDKRIAERPRRLEIANVSEMQ